MAENCCTWLEMADADAAPFAENPAAAAVAAAVAAAAGEAAAEGAAGEAAAAAVAGEAAAAATAAAAAGLLWLKARSTAYWQRLRLAVPSEGSALVPTGDAEGDSSSGSFLPSGVKNDVERLFPVLIQVSMTLALFVS